MSEFPITFVGGSLDGLSARVSPGCNVVEAADPATPAELTERDLWNVQVYARDGDVFRLHSTREAVHLEAEDAPRGGGVEAP